jgi:hypothetical protein
MNVVHKPEHTVFPLRERNGFIPVRTSYDILVLVDNLRILAQITTQAQNFKSARFVQPNSVTATGDQEI